MKRHGLLLPVTCIVGLITIAASTRAEAPPPPAGGNPFGSAQSGQGYGEDDNFVQPNANDRGNTMNGFQQPSTAGAAATPPPSPTLSGRNLMIPKPPHVAQPQQSFPATPPGSNSLGEQAASNSHKAAPKLKDYLELDSAVKGLEVKNFDLPDKDIKDVVTLISKWTGKNFILDSTRVHGKITIMAPSQVTLQEAYEAFLSALDANNLTTVQEGRFIRIIDSAEARRSPVKTYAGDYAPKDDQFITRIFQLKFINADEVQREFRDLASRFGRLFAYEPTNSIIITDTGANVARIKDILETLDVKNYEATLHVLRVKNNSSKAISDMLSAIYGGGSTTQTPGRPSFYRSPLERMRGGGIVSKIIPDEATNSLVVLANSQGFEQLKQLVAKLDVRVTDTGHIHVYYCEYAKAEDLASTLAALAGGGKGGGASHKPSFSNTSHFGNTPTGGGPSSSTSSGPVTAELENGVKITSDEATNALVITANAADYQTIRKVIKKLDIPRLQVFVESAIMEVEVDHNNNLGSNIAVGVPGRGFGGGFVGDSNAVQNLIEGGIPSEGLSLPIFGGPSFQANLPSTFGQTGQPGAPTPGVPGFSVPVSAFMGLINILSRKTNTSILSTPQIVALDNEQAEFKVQDEIPVETTENITPQTGLATGSIDRLKTGIDIKLTPHVNAASRTIRLEIQEEVDDVKSNAEVPKALADVQKATTSRVTNTTIVARDQDLVMLGGLMHDEVQDIVTKVPLLGDIPIVGWLFKSKSTTTTKTDLVILMHPRIIGTTLDAASVVEDAMGKRKHFLKKYSYEEPVPDEVKEIEGDLKQQKARARNEPIYNYRNNNDEEPVDTGDTDNTDDTQPQLENKNLQLPPEPQGSNVPPAEAPLNPPPSEGANP